MKKKILLLMSTGLVLLFLMQSYAPPPPPSEYNDIVANYDQQPPIALNYWVQKLADTLATGENMAMRIEYQDEGVEMPDSLNIYLDDRKYISFRDDGNYPDSIDNDKIYTAYLKEDINSFLSSIYTYQKKLQSDGKFIKFTGHVGEEMDAQKDLVAFDFETFDRDIFVKLDPGLLSAAFDCGNDILKENSLFITDRDVVEDGVRSNQHHIGQTAHGKWTFGELMKNIANTTATNVSVKDFIKAWVNTWMQPQTVNGQTVATRKNALDFMIAPWLKLANNNNTSLAVTASNWGDIWDATNEEAIIQYAPFKLTAIVNRMDLRGNKAYSPIISNAGETRFIFTLIYPFSEGTQGVVQVANYPPRVFNQNGGGQTPNNGNGFIDWQGMNVIFEYQNLQTNCSDVLGLANQWKNLSTKTLGSPEYNSALEHITDLVTLSGIAAGKANGSAIGRIRTNEKVFSEFNKNVGPSPPISDNQAWKNMDWEFRQFELNASNHLLEMVPLTNTPVDNAHFAPNLIGYDYNVWTDGVNVNSNPDQKNLLDWCFYGFNYNNIVNERHNMPAVYNNMPLLAAAGRIDAEYSHYLDLQWDEATTNYDHNYVFTTLFANQGNDYGKRLRRNLSLNTCQGCHGGETNTIFTHVNPVPFGQKLNYWSSNTSGGISEGIFFTGLLDRREYVLTPMIVPFSQGFTLLAPDNSPVQNTGQWGEDETAGSNSNFAYFMGVSAFLTGRSFKGLVNPPPSNWNSIPKWTDDLDESNDNDDDDKLNGLFWVNDPSNNYNSYNPDITYNQGDLLTPEKRWGYNDLKRRKEDLCALLNCYCRNGHLVEQIVAITNFNPLPLHGH